MVMYIGALASQTGTTPKAIRLYESLGLLGRVQRLGKYRVYTDQHLQQVRLIKQAQALGFRLADVVPAMQGRKVEPDWVTLARQVDQRRFHIAQEIARLQALDTQLQAINIEIWACAEKPQPAPLASCA
jgi:DNA-binding transcriptional MerR regulator